MNAADMILPKPRSWHELPGVSHCSTAKINWLEASDTNLEAAAVINRALAGVGQKPLPVIARTNLGCRNRISLQLCKTLSKEDYVLTLGHDQISIFAGSDAALFYGAQSLAQIIGCSAQMGGHELILPAGVIEDGPRFQWRGFMLDSARHFQPKKIIFEILDRMAEYKLNIFHWHFVDRQGWRPIFNSAPELATQLPESRSYSHGTYSLDDLKEIRDYAASRFITVIPELEMPGHSAAVFLTHPELACPLETKPFDVDVWEYCLGNPEVPVFLKKLLKEIADIFVNSPVIHIGGDEAGTSRWHVCPKCQQAIQKGKLNNERELEHHFMTQMAQFVEDLGREPMSWGTKESDGFSGKMILQDWLGNGDTTRFVRNGNRVVSSVHTCNYFDYPYGDFEPVVDWQKKIYEFEPVPAELSADESKFVLGGEGCLWTEQIPFQRVLPRTIPRMRALAEMLWTSSSLKNFESFLLRERLITCSGLFRYC